MPLAERRCDQYSALRPQHELTGCQSESDGRRHLSRAAEDTVRGEGVRLLLGSALGSRAPSPASARAWSLGSGAASVLGLGERLWGDACAVGVAMVAAGLPRRPGRHHRLARHLPPTGRWGQGDGLGGCLWDWGPSTPRVQGVKQQLCVLAQVSPPGQLEDTHRVRAKQP